MLGRKSESQRSACERRVSLCKCDCQRKKRVQYVGKAEVFLSDSVDLNFLSMCLPHISLSFLLPRNYLHVTYLLLYLDSYLHGRTCVEVLHAGVCTPQCWSVPLYNSDDTAVPSLLFLRRGLTFIAGSLRVRGSCGVLSCSARLKLVLLRPCSEALDYVDNYAATQVRLPPIRSSAACGREKSSQCPEQPASA